MCDDHSGVLIPIPTASAAFPDGRPRPDGTKRGIDACIAPLVQALNAAGVGTVASCCGHRVRGGFGVVSLTDGRELLISPDWETTRAAEDTLRRAGLFGEGT